jgi:hypothetical protein
MCPSIWWWSRPPWHTGRQRVCAWWAMWEGRRKRSEAGKLYQAEDQEQPRTGAGKARYRSGTGVLAVSGMDGWVAQAVGEGSCIYLAVQMHAQSFKASTDGLVKVPSFRPSQAPWTAPAGSSILLNLVRWNPALHRLRPRKFRMGASTRLAAGH